MLCSDGLTDLVDDTLIAARLATGDPDEAATALVAAALDAGGRDNVTCLEADLDDGPQVCRDGRLLGAMRDPYLVVDASAVRLDSLAS